MGTLQKMQTLVSLWILCENLFLLHAGFVENHDNAPIISTELQFLTLPSNSSFASLSQQTPQTTSFPMGETWKSFCWRAGVQVKG